jgi:hypothetical protein
MKYQICFIILLLFLKSYPQYIDYGQAEPFITSYNPLISRNIYPYDDFTVFHPEWGIILLGTGESGELEEISRLHCDFFMMQVRDGNFLYLSNWDFDEYSDAECLCIQKIDVNDPESPLKCDELYLDIPAYDNYIYVIENYLIFVMPYIDQYGVVNLNDFTFCAYHDYSGGVTRGFGDNIIEYNPIDQFKIYELQSDSLSVIASNLDIFSAHQEAAISDFVALSDETVCTVSYSDIVIWNINDITDWEVIDTWEANDGSTINQSGNIVINENLLYINTWETIYCLELDENYNVVSFTETLIPNGLRQNDSFGSVDDHLIVPTTEGITDFQITDDGINFLGFFGGLPLFDNHQIIGNNYFLTTRSFYNYSGILKWDIADPRDPQFDEYLLPDENYLFARIGSSFFYMQDYYNQLWDIYSYYDDDMHLLLSLPMADYQDVFTFIITDQYDEGSFYISHYITKNLKKYEMIDNELELVLDIDFPGEDCGFINNGIGYFLTNEANQDLIIYSGFNENEPVHANEYENIIYDGEYWVHKINNSFLSLTHTSNGIIVMGYQGDELTEQSFTLANSGIAAPIIYHDYLFSFQNNNLFVYNFTENTSGNIAPIQNITFNYLLNKLIYHESTEGDFLFCFGLSAVSVVEISITDGVVVSEIVYDPLSINAFPNPVNSNQNGQVNFQLSDQIRLNQNKGELSIYNIKGQLVHRQVLDFSRDSSLQWDCRLDSGNEAPSGVYLYRVGAGEESSVGKFIIAK